MMFSKALVVTALMLALVIPACFEAPETVSPSDKRAEPDLEAVIEGMNVRCYFAEHSFTKEVVASVRSKEDVANEILRLEGMGYRFDPSASLIEIGSTEDGKEIRIAVLGFESTENPDAEAVFIMDFEGEGLSTWVPLRYISNENLAGPEAIALDEVLWVEVLDDGGAQPGPFSSTQRWSWQQYTRCEASCMLAVGYQCLRSCWPTGPGFIKCMSVCTSGGAVFCAVWCLFQQLF